MPTDLPPVEIPEAWLVVLEALQRHGVQYVVAGSAADAIVEGNPSSAAVLVVAPAPYRRNLERVAAALEGVGVWLRGEKGKALPVAPAQLVNHPSVRWRLLAGDAELDVIGSAVGDGEFSIRLWRTRRLELTAAGRSIDAEVERVAEFAVVAPG